jgi:hypothetical protein
LGTGTAASNLIDFDDLPSVAPLLAASGDDE